MFEIIRFMLGANGDIIARRPLQPSTNSETTPWLWLGTKPLAFGATTATTSSGNAGGRATSAAGNIALLLRRLRKPTLRRKHRCRV
jgi:hypothetical protein